MDPLMLKECRRSRAQRRVLRATGTGVIVRAREGLSTWEVSSARRRIRLNVWIVCRQIVKMAMRGSLFLASFADTPFESRAAKSPPLEVRFYLAEEGARPA